MLHYIEKMCFYTSFRSRMVHALYDVRKLLFVCKRPDIPKLFSGNCGCSYYLILIPDVRSRRQHPAVKGKLLYSSLQLP